MHTTYVCMRTKISLAGSAVNALLLIFYYSKGFAVTIQACIVKAQFFTGELFFLVSILIVTSHIV